MTTPKQQKAIDLYTVLMTEARLRIEAINSVLTGQTKLAQGIGREICYLQLRMLCETIAIGCLVAHGDVVASHIKQFEKEYAADKIIKMMEKLNTDFFPQQIETSFDPISNRMNVSGNTKPGALKKNELTDLYHKCGDILHRGRVGTVLSSDPLQHGEIDSEEIAAWGQKVEDLLGCHMITLSIVPKKSAVLMFCTLRDPQRDFQTTVNRVELG